MRGDAEDISTHLRAAGWAQGSVLDRDSLAALGYTSHDLAIVLSQDCDVVQSVDVEPMVELILGRRRNVPRPDCQFGRNPREIDLPLMNTDGGVSMRICDRVFVSKDDLSAYRPSTTTLDPTDITLLATWIAKRYTRPAWPDAFNDRLRSVDNRLERLFKTETSRPITAILLMLDRPGEELSEGEDYDIAVWLTVSVESRMDGVASGQAASFEQRFIDIMKSCKGIKLREIEIRSEADVSLDDLRHFRRFDRDYRSIAPKPGGQLAPNE